MSVSDTSWQVLWEHWCWYFKQSKTGHSLSFSKFSVKSTILITWAKRSVHFLASVNLSSLINDNLIMILRRASEVAWKGRTLVARLDDLRLIPRSQSGRRELIPTSCLLASLYIGTSAVSRPLSPPQLGPDQLLPTSPKSPISGTPESPHTTSASFPC